MKIYFRTPPVSKRLRGWLRIARRVRLAFQTTLVVEFGPRQRRQDARCIGQAPVSRASL